MIRKSSAIATAAVVLSLLVHFLGLSFTSSDLPAQSSGDATNEVVELGNAFEDVAEALSAPVELEPAPVPEPPVESLPEPDFAKMPTSKALVASVDPQRVFAPGTDTAKAVQPKTTEPPEPDEEEAPEPQIVEPSGGDKEAASEANSTPPVEPDTVAQAPEGNPEAEPEPGAVANATLAITPAPQQLAALPALVAPVTPESEPTAVPVIPLEHSTVDPEAGASDLAVDASPRPRLPSRRPSVDRKGQLDGSAKYSQLLSPPLIESPLAAYLRDRTDPTVRQNRGAQSSGLGFAASRSSGNSDVTNYAGQVLAHLNRTPLVPVSARGFARVFFEINSDGSLAWVDIIDGTGSQEIDRAAKEQVRSAAPFPRPPQGANRKLVFVYRIN